MAKGKRPKRSGGGGGGLRRPPPGPPREPPEESSKGEPMQQQQARYGGSGGSATPSARGTRAPGGGGGDAAFPRKKGVRHQQRRDDPPEDGVVREGGDPPPASRLRARNDAPPAPAASGPGDDARGGGNLRPRDGGGFPEKPPGRRVLRAEHAARRPSPSPPPSSSSSARSATRSLRRGDGTEKSNDDLFRRGGYPPCGGGGGDNDGDDPPLDMDEEERYEDYQDQLYRRRYDCYDDDDDARLRQQQQGQPRCQQSTTTQQQRQPARHRQPPLQPLSSSHRQFDLTPLCDVEMTSLGGRKQKQKRMKETTSTRKDGADDLTPSYTTGRYAQVGHKDGRASGREQSNPLEYNGRVLAYLDDVEGDEEDEEDSEDSLEGGGPRRHEEFYNHAYYDDDDEDDDDEGRPLMPMLPRSSILTRSEKCLNRTLMLAFATVFLLVVRDRTPWWKEHVRRASSLSHHHHHVLAGTDDDDNLEGVQYLDPMTVYNSNDDDSTHTRDHDPLHQYDYLTKKDVSLDDGGGGRPRDDDNRKNDQAGKRISNRPASKSLHHGFMDEAYEDRPAAKNSMSKAAMTAGVLGSRGGVDVLGGTDDVGGVKASLLPPPPPLNRSGTVDVGGGGVSKPGGVAKAGGGVMGGSIMNGGSPARPLSKPPERAADSIGAPVPEQRAVGTPTSTVHQVSTIPEISDVWDSRDTLVEWGAPDDDVDPSAQQVHGGKSSPRQGEGETSAKSPSLPSETSSAPALDQPIFSPMSGEDVKSAYEDSFFRWNHPLRPIAPSDGGKDVPVFWRVPRSASSSVESVMSFCYRMVLANSMGTAAGHGLDATLDIITVGTGARYANVDMASPSGILRAKTMELGSSGLVDVISTPFLFETANIFKGIHETGKCFTLLRHPVDRAISMYHHFKIVENGNPSAAQYGGMTIDEFADSFAENNWMVRFLANKRTGSLTWHDLEAAKEVFGRKCLVGLVEKAAESLRRYERFFGWDTKIPNSAAKDKCVRQYLEAGDKRKEHPNYVGTAAWETLRKKNEYDEILYEYAKNLYDQQSTIYEKIPK